MAGNIEGEIVYYSPPEPLPPEARPDFETLPLAPYRMPISDIRGHEADFSLAKQGFARVDAPTAVKDFNDPEEVRRTYTAEVLELVKRVAGASHTILSSPGLVRMSRRASRPPPGATHTGNFVHADYSPRSGEQWLRRALPPEEAERRLKQRYAIFNVWRAFSPAPQDVPLALCDARSVLPRDVQNCILTLGRPGQPPVTWENTAFKHNANHRWFYCSDMNRDDAFVFSSFDTHSTWTDQVPHTAFEDLTCPDDAPPRASMEIRVFAFYEE
jgi:hypothetical protein